MFLLFPVKVEEHMLLCEEVADSWRDVEDQKGELENQLRETEQQLQTLIRSPAELEPKVAQNQLDRAQVCALSLCILLFTSKAAMQTSTSVDNHLFFAGVPAAD